MAKEKKETKASKNTLREFSAGGVVYKNDKERLLWLVTRSKPSNDYPFDVWRLPKGWIDDDDSFPGPIASGKIKATLKDLQAAALREVLEEGGVEAKIITKVGTEIFVFNSKLRKAKVMKFVTFFLMKRIKDRHNGFGSETSEVVWLEHELARKKLTHSGEKKILDKAQELIDSDIQSNLV